MPTSLVSEFAALPSGLPASPGCLASGGARLGGALGMAAGAALGPGPTDAPASDRP